MAMSLLTVFGGAIAVLNSNHKVEARVFSDAAAKGIFSGVLFILIFMLPPKLGIVNTIFLTSLLITDKMNMYHSCFIRM